ncbi:MAG TPA: tRNA 2-thiouridine(34) synthase MnmA [Deltaproteobacteria bacterium]|nr:tRNA 2-thiouridine(34) synthase MnmA [Deltaproteobacteria bacterium]
MKKVLVALSGGIDSSVAAYLLKKQGYSVVGATMALTSYDKSDRKRSCCSEKDRYYARYAAAQLDIPFEIIDYRELFKKEVIKPFINAYRMAQTPNPCILCNDRMKFFHLLNFAKKQGISHIATGHYANIVEYKGRKFVAKGKDSKKDQSYFLYGLDVPQIDNLLFPLGNLHKSEVRKIADSINLITKKKPESQEICFVDNDYRSLIYEDAKPKCGEFVDETGNSLGEHKGIENFTVGQRKGLGISSDRPFYVKAIDSVSGDIILAGRDGIISKSFYMTNFILKDDREQFSAYVKIRSQSKPVKSELILLGNKIQIKSEFGFWGVTPGQSAVAYIDDRIVAGGIILPIESPVY